MSFGPYSFARIAAYPPTPYFSLGQPARVREYADMAAQPADQSQSSWSQCLVRLDVATALLLAEAPDPEQAASLGIEALSAVAGNPIESIRRRGGELVAHAEPWQRLGAVTELAEATRVLAVTSGPSR
jgi:hypothetical protein